jgi:hypothetical protein
VISPIYGRVNSPYGRLMWRMGYTGGRIALVVVGLAILLVGWVSAISAEYASRSNSTMESHGGTAVVYAVDEQVQDSEGHPLQVPVFEGTEEEALAYADEQLNDPDLFLPNALMVVGVLLIVVALIPIRKTKHGEPENAIELVRPSPDYL